MVKNRKEQFDLSSCKIGEKFNWVSKVETSKERIAGTKETICVVLGENTMNVKDFSYQRQEFEKFLQNFYEVKKGRNQVVVMWQESKAIVAVF